MKISQVSIRHLTITAMVLIVLMAFGFFSLGGQNIEFMSELNLPSIIVLSVYPGAGSEDVEEEVTRVLEDEFVTLPGYKSMDSISRNSLSVITVYYQDGTDPYDQLEEIRYRISTLQAELPDGLEGEPRALVGGDSMLPIITFSVDGGSDTKKVTEYLQDELIPQINHIQGVADVAVHGGEELEASIIIHVDELAAKGISVTQVYNMIKYGNTKVPIGSTTYQGKTLDIRYDGSLTSLENLKDLSIGFTEEGTPISLGSVAEVSLSSREKNYEVMSDNNQLLVVSVTKRSDGNIVKINRQIKKLLENETQRTGGALQFFLLGDYSRTTLASLGTVIRSGVMGMVMAILVIMLFLGDARATLIIAFSIPLSLLFAFIGMRLMGISINLMSLSGLVAALGMVVDGSIVMLEQIYRHYRMRNVSVSECIDKGSSEVGSSILASTLTTIVVFLPISLLSGLIGMILKDVALTLILALAGAFLVAVVFVPFFAKLFLKDQAPFHKERRFERGMAKVERGYKRILSWSLNHSSYVLILSSSILLVSGFAISKLGLSFLPSTDNSDFYVNLDFPEGYSLEQTKRKSLQAEAIIRSEVPEVENLVFYIGIANDFTALEKANISYAQVVLVPVAQRKRDIHDIIVKVQKAISSQIPDCTVRVENGGFDKLLGYASGGGGFGLTLVSEDMDLLYAEALRLENQLKTDPLVMSTSMNTSFDSNQLVLSLSREAMNSLGINSYEAGLTSLILFKGVDVGRFTGQKGERYSITLQSDVKGQPITSSTLARTTIYSMAGTPLSLATAATMDVKRSLSEINHTDRAKAITITASLVGEDTSPTNTRLKEYLAANPLAEGVQSKSGGILELIEDSIQPLIVALLVAWFLVYTVLVIQFERFRQPAIVLVSIPFCVIGVVLGLLVFGSTISIVSLLGIIALGGIVVNNGIILIDYVNLLRKRRAEEQKEDQVSLLDAIGEGCASRIRPILMTTLTTLLGVIPMAVASGEGAEIYAPLGQAIAGGLLTSTLITLFIIPVLYYKTESRRLLKGKPSV